MMQFKPTRTQLTVPLTFPPYLEGFTWRGAGTHVGRSDSSNTFLDRGRPSRGLCVVSPSLTFTEVLPLNLTRQLRTSCHSNFYLSTPQGLYQSRCHFVVTTLITARVLSTLHARPCLCHPLVLPNDSHVVQSDTVACKAHFVDKDTSHLASKHVWSPASPRPGHLTGPRPSVHPIVSAPSC